MDVVRCDQAGPHGSIKPTSAPTDGIVRLEYIMPSIVTMSIACLIGKCPLFGVWALPRT
jgi:hypothetical protein